ncbi:hypothetical protein A2U01_0099265, partial [Trifolium medium]|nr:hypothetical protein [Trifolium medium]
QTERQHREMMQVLQQQRAEQPPIHPQPNQGVQPQVPRGNPVFREFCRKSASHRGYDAIYRATMPTV